MRASNVIARNAQASAVAEVWRERARQMRAAGRRLSEIAEAVGRDGATVWRAIADVPFVLPRAAAEDVIRPRAAAEDVIRPRAAAEDVIRPRAAAEDVIRVPAWVRRADLVEDFRDVARSLGEHEAAAHCRRLTAAMRAPS